MKVWDFVISKTLASFYGLILSLIIWEKVVGKFNISC